MPRARSREAVALFHDAAAFEQAVAELVAHGIPAERIAMLASCDAVEAKFGHRLRKTAQLEDMAEAPRVAYVPAGEESERRSWLIGALSYVAASFGLILASSAGLVPMILAGTAAGGAIATVGEVVKRLVGHQRADRYEEQLKCGGILLWVQLDDSRDARSAIRILRGRGGEDIHLHAPPSPRKA
jgi:hypothetical protein